MKIFKPKYFSLKKAARILKRKGKFYSPAYLSSLAKKGELKAIKIGNKWITTKLWLKDFINHSKIEKGIKKEKIEEEGIVLPLYFGWAIKLDLVKFYKQNFNWNFRKFNFKNFSFKNKGFYNLGRNIVSFRKRHQRFAVLLFAFGLILGGFFLYHLYSISAVTYEWLQTDWSEGEDTSNYPLHPTNQNNWTKYWSKTSNIKTTTGGQISFNTTSTLAAKSAVLPSARKDAVAVYSSAVDKSYIIGGYYLDDSTNDPNYLTEIVRYDASSDISTITNIGSLPVELRGHSGDINSSDGKIYIFGGYNNSSSTFSSTIYSFDPANDSISASDTGHSLPSGREYAPAVYAPNVGKFYIFGGYYLNGSYNSVYLDEIVEYNSSTGAVATTTIGLPHPLKGASAVYYPVDQKIYIFGGFDETTGDYSAKIYSFDPANPNSGASDTGYTMPSARAYTSVSYFNRLGGGFQKMYIFGGYRLTGDSSVYLDEVLSFSGSANATAQTETLAKNLKASSVAFNSSDSRVYIFGGYDGTGEAFSDSIYHYQLDYGPLLSSPYNTTDPVVILASIAWNETVPSGTDILFQIRTATNNNNGTPADNADDTPNTWTDWCGPDNTGDGCSTTTYFTDKTGGDAVDDMFKDAVDDQWIQYRVYLVTDSTNNSPTLSDVTITYVINTAPTVSNVTASQDATGTVNVTYDVTDVEEATTTIYLLYDLGITLGSDIDVSTTTISVSDTSYFASTGTIQLDSEQISYTGKTSNTLTGCTRGANNTLYYKTTHSSGDVVWIKANTLSGDSGSVAIGSGKSIAWTAKTDIDGYYQLSTVKVRVVANDGNAARQVGQADSSVFEFDTKNPVVGITAVGNTGIDINANTITSKGTEKTNVLSNTLNLSCTDDTSLQMILSNDGTFDTEIYQSYASSTSWDLDAFCSDQEYGCVKTVYVKFKDTKGNEIGSYTDTITLDNNAPAVPGNMFIQDVSNASTSEFRLFITWDKNTESDWIRYEVYRSVDGTNFSVLSTTTNINLNYILESSLTEGQTYYYKVRSVDDIINNSEYSSTVSMVAGGNPNDNVPPTISSVATSTPTINSVIVTWTTNEISTSQVLYSTNASVPSGSATKGVSGYDTSHSVTLTGLNNSTVYYFKAQSIDGSSNSAESAIYSFTTASPDTTGPFIFTPITVTSITENSATINWDTDEASTSFVEYSTSTGFSSGTLQGDFNFVVQHSIALHGLNSATTYYYKVRSTDSSNNESISSEGSFSTNASSADVTAPVISSVATSSVAYNTATVTWTTNENSSSFVEFGLNTSYGRIYGQDELLTSHSVNLPKDLSSGTTYHFRARSIDGAGNEGFSGDYSFITSGDPSDSTAPVISNISIGEPGKTSITMTWDTDEVADSYIGYSQATTTYSLEQGSPTMVASHSINLVGLTPNTTYYFQIKSKDPSGNQQIDNNSGQGYQFTTLTSVSNPPVISNIQIVDVGSDLATITWNTDKSSNSFVEYGLDTAYGWSQGQYDSVTSHSVTIKGLLSEAIYHFRVRSTDADSNEAVSQDYTLTTEEAVDITSPVVTSVGSSNITLTSADIGWTTNENADNIVSYGTSTSALSFVAGSNNDSTTAHSVSLSNLSPGNTYYYQVQSRDSAGNITIDNDSDSYYSFVTTADTTAPVISAVSAPVIDRNSATVIWTSDEDSTSQAEYSLNSDLSISSETTEVTDLQKSHSVIISSLTSDTLYYFRVKSKDSSDNLATSSISSFTTAGASEDSTAPIISAVATSSPSMTGIIVTWTTDEDSNSIVDYGITTSLGSLAGQLDDSTTAHSVTLSGLSGNTSYYFQVRSQDSAGNTGTDNNSGNYYIFTTQQDSTAPTISSVTTAVVSDTSASITWQTDEDATSQVFYGTSNSYGSQTVLDATLTKNHSVTISSLSRQTTYYYKVTSTDSTNNSTTDDNSGNGYSFTTTQEPGETIYLGSGGGGGGGIRLDTSKPVIRDIEIFDIATTSAKFRWKTSEVASKLVEYGFTQDYGQIQGSYEPEGTEHEVIMDNLLSGTIYHYRLISLDAAGNIAKSDDSDFKTLGELGEEGQYVPGQEPSTIDLSTILEKIKSISSSEELVSIYEIIEETAQRIMEPPFIAGEYPIAETNSDSAQIIWVTDQEANTMVAYSSQNQYNANFKDVYRYIIGNREDLTTYHFVEIDNLEPATTYHFQIRSKAKIGPLAKSKDLTFTTNPLGIEILGLRMSGIGIDFAEFSWDTNMATNFVIEYTDLQTGKTLTSGDNSFLRHHSYKLENLGSDNDYSAVIIIEDEYGNKARSKNIEFSTGKDEVPPIINQVRANSTLYPGKENRIQTIIDWQTNEPSTSQIFWQEGIENGTVALKSAKDTILSTKHVIVTTHFKPSTVYKFWVESEDVAGNKAKSKEFTILTPKRTETVLEMIMKNFEEIFGWTQRLK